MVKLGLLCFHASSRATHEAQVWVKCRYTHLYSFLSTSGVTDQLLQDVHDVDRVCFSSSQHTAWQQIVKMKHKIYHAQVALLI
jgi:hypothetical protein